MIGPCAKQMVKATIVMVNGTWVVGTNYCRNAQPECPRVDMPTGVGYHLCKEVCDQAGHAEIVAIENAGGSTQGATLYLEGHTYACTTCIAAFKAAGGDAIIIGAPPALA